MQLGLNRRETFPRSAQLPIGAGPGAPGPPGNLNPMLLNGTSRFHAGTYAVGQQSNNFINHSQRVIPSEGETDRDLKDNLDYAMPHFLRLPPRIMSRYSANKQNSLLSDMPEEMKSWSSFNYYLKSEAGRREYGGDKDCKRLLEDYQLGGVLQTAPSDDYRMKSELKVAFTLGKRVRVPNVVAATGREVQRGDYIFLIFTRRSLDDEKAADKTGPRRNTAFPDLGDLGRRDAEPSSDVPQTYWRVEPLAMHGKAQPPAELYMTLDFIGDYRFWGVVSDVFSSPSDGVDIQAPIARRAIFPEFSDPDVHRRELTKLLHIELQLCVK